MRTAKLLLALALLALGTGCGRTMIPFTAELRAEHRLSDADVKNLQFYLSDDITLRRELESGSRQVTGNHRLLLVSGKTVEEVTVAGGTPGVAVSVSDERIAVSFEPGSSLSFSTTGELEAAHEVVKSDSRFAEPPDPFPGNHGDDDDPRFGGRRASSFGRYLLATDTGGRVTFMGLSFGTVDDSARAHLMIDSEKLEEVVESEKVLPGVRLSGP
ncbi:MAG: DNA-directed RNA polymerase [Polyangiaceae bacterium]